MIRPTTPPPANTRDRFERGAWIGEALRLVPKKYHEIVAAQFHVLMDRIQEEHDKSTRGVCSRHSNAKLQGACTCVEIETPDNSPFNMRIVADEYGTSLDKLDMAERIAHKVSENNPEAFDWNEKKSGFLTKRTIHSRLTLADILHTLMRMGCYFYINHNFHLVVCCKDGRSLGSTEWDCSDDNLDKQSMETVYFLFRIICSNPT